MFGIKDETSRELRRISDEMDAEAPALLRGHIVAVNRETGAPAVIPGDFVLGVLAAGAILSELAGHGGMPDTTGAEVLEIALCAYAESAEGEE